MRKQLGLDEAGRWPSWQETKFAPHAGTPLFPRIDEDRRKALLEKWKPKRAVEKTDPNQITFEEFQRLDLRVGVITEAEAVPKAKKLLKVIVDLGKEKRQVVAGIAEAYQPGDLVGKQVLFLANLKPATIRGVVSEGMILAAGEEQVVALSGLDRPAPP